MVIHLLPMNNPDLVLGFVQSVEKELEYLNQLIFPKKLLRRKKEIGEHLEIKFQINYIVR